MTNADTIVMGRIVVALVCGLPAYVLIKVFQPAFFSREDTRTPVWIAAGALAVNIALNFYVVPRYGIVGLAAATAITSSLNVAALYTILQLRGWFHFTAKLGGRIARQIIACLAMGAVLYVLLPVLAPYVAGGALARIGALGGLVLAGRGELFRGGLAGRRARQGPPSPSYGASGCLKARRPRRIATQEVYARRLRHPAHRLPSPGQLSRRHPANWVRMQDEMEPGNRAQVAGSEAGRDGQRGSADNNQCLFFLADLHAISLPHDPAELARATREMAAALVACGIDPARSILFNQAQVPAHAELQWLLMGTARMGWLNRMTQWKDKAGKNREGQSVALFAYPVLQAADVLLYQATHVPVGEDQKQHLELARDIAHKFNTDFCPESGPLFTLPEPFIPPQAARIMSLRDGSAKMSKSDPSDMSRINLTDDADMITLKVKKAKSDAEPLPSETAGLEGRPEAANLVGIYAALAGASPGQVLAEHGGQGFGAFKPVLGALLVETLGPIRERFVALATDDSALDAILARGAERARAIGSPTLDAAYRALGLVRG